MYYPITDSKLTSSRQKWQTLLRKHGGVAPVGLGLAHMIAESNSEVNPTVRDIHRYPLGLMQVPLRTGKAHGQNEETLRQPEINLYIWSQITNQDANALHVACPGTWSTPNLDFWTAVRLYWIVGRTVFDNLRTTALKDGAEFTGTAGLIAWITTRMAPTQRFGKFSRALLTKIASHLTSVWDTMIKVHGPAYTTPHWSSGAFTTPGNYFSILEAGARR